MKIIKIIDKKNFKYRYWNKITNNTYRTSKAFYKFKCISRMSCDHGFCPLLHTDAHFKIQIPLKLSNVVYDTLASVRA